MYRVSPFTYLVGSVLSTGLGGSPVVCSDIEILHIPPPDNQDCSNYLLPYANATGSNLLNPTATSDCQLCSLASSDQFLAQLSIDPDDIWRNVGLLFIYVVFNAVMAVFLYWLIRVPKKNRILKSRLRGK